MGQFWPQFRLLCCRWRYFASHPWSFTNSYWRVENSQYETARDPIGNTSPYIKNSNIWSWLQEKAFKLDAAGVSEDLRRVLCKENILKPNKTLEIDAFLSFIHPVCLSLLKDLQFSHHSLWVQSTHPNCYWLASHEPWISCLNKSWMLFFNTYYIFNIKHCLKHKN